MTDAMQPAAAIRNPGLIDEPDPSIMPSEAPVRQRFLDDRAVDYGQAISAARAYVGALADGEVAWLHAKPFDPTPGNPQYFRLMYDLLNILQVLQLPQGGRVLEIGGGPGWITEILLMLGYRVDVLEPAIELIAIAEERCAALAAHYRYSAPLRLQFHPTTLEEIELAERSFDAVLFFDVLHHVVDERAALAKCFRLLAPGGVLGIVEAAWRPGCVEMERELTAEIEKFGVLENPFTVEYVDQLLGDMGFIHIERFTGVNGFFRRQDLDRPLRAFAAPLACLNNVVARRPTDEESSHPDCAGADPAVYVTGAALDLLGGGIDPDAGTAALTVRLTNTGATRFNHRRGAVGHVTLALRRGNPGAEDFIECRERHPLTETLFPGQDVILRLNYTLPPDVDLQEWVLDLVAEEVFWFSCRGAVPLPVPAAPVLPKPCA
jgi:SAM-dependent methyltransferase